MKKLFVFLVAAMAVISASAQMRTSRTFTKVKSRTEWIVRVGPSFNRLTGYDKQYVEDVKVGSKVGFDLDLGFNKYIGGSDLYWGMELGLGTRGTKFDFEYGDYKESYSKTMYNVKYSPFTIGYKFAVTDMIKIDPHLGGYISYDFASSDSYDGDEYDPDTFDSWNKFDAGLQFGAGVWYGRFNLDFMYQVGFCNADFENGDYDKLPGGKTGNFLIRVGYSF